MANIMLKDIDTLNKIIDAINNNNLETAKNEAIAWRDKLQGEIDTMEEYYKNLEFQNETLELLNKDVGADGNPYIKGEGI